MDIFFSNSRDFWGDIENAMGEYDEKEIADWCSPDGGIDYDHFTRSIAAIEDGPDWVFKPIIDEFFRTFNEWIESIDISNAKAKFSLSTKARYLTFNYTETLERLYNIPQQNILHVHGSRLKHDEYIIGHNMHRDPNDAYKTETELDFIQDTWSKIIKWMNKLVKDTNGIIQNNQVFFNSLGDIDKIVVLGHSLNLIDQPYMKEVEQKSKANAQWIISYHTQNDKKQIKNFITRTRLQNYILLEL